MLDVHVLTGIARPEWVIGCLASIGEAMRYAGFPVSLYVLEAERGHIGRGRARGYAKGDAPYVTCVDDDDEVFPWAFREMADPLRAGAAALCTVEMVEYNGVLLEGRARHHLTVYRRSDLIDHTLWPCCGDVAQQQRMPADAVELPLPGYLHRIYSDSPARVLRRAHPHELEAASHG